MKRIYRIWPIVILAILIGIGIIICGMGSNAVIAIDDNMNLLVPQYMMLKNTGKFAMHDAGAPYLGGIYRDILPSELNIYSWIYMLLPGYYAYAGALLLKVIIAISGALLLSKSILGEEFGKHGAMAAYTGLAYGLISVLPLFGIYFASLPYLILFVRNIERKPRLIWYLLLLVYPAFSNLLYFGITVLIYLFVYFVYRCIKLKTFRGRLLGAWFCLLTGYFICSVRLLIINISYAAYGLEFKGRNSKIYSDSSVDIIHNMLRGATVGDSWKENGLLYGIVPLCLAFAIVEILVYIKNENAKGIFKDSFFGILLLIVFNSVVYGLGTSKTVYDALSAVIINPWGQGYIRTDYINPVLWCILLAIAVYRCSKRTEHGAALGVIPLAAAAVIVLVPGKYNDILHTAERLAGAEADITGQPTYGEYYDSDFWNDFKNDINYKGEWFACYGLDSAVLNYNGIKTVDGNIGVGLFDYNIDFGKMTAPAMEQNAEAAEDFDNFPCGYRLYSAGYGVLTDEYGICEYESDSLTVNLDALKDYCVRYIVSAVEIDNAGEVGISEVKRYSSDRYGDIYLYMPVSRYMDKEHCSVPYEERQVPQYDCEEMDSLIEEAKQLAADACEYAKEHEDMTDDEICEALEGDRVLEIYDRLEKSMGDISTAYQMENVAYYRNVLDDSVNERIDKIYEDSINYYDLYLQALRDICASPYSAIMSERLSELLIRQFVEYEDLTEKEKELQVELENLQQEYEIASMDDYSYEYKGEEWNLERLYDEYDQLSEMKSQKIYKGIMKTQAECLGEIYCKILKVCEEIAEEAGYSDYAQYIYSEGYFRDYTVEDVKALCYDFRHSDCTDNIDEISDILMDAEAPGWITMNDTANFEALLPYMKEFDGELGEAMEYLMEYHLYDMNASDTKPDKGFTIDMKSYNDAFIFDSPYMNYNDIYTYVHEFGHFNSSYHKKEGTFEEYTNIDTGEIHSQGLELLFAPYYGEIYGEEAGDYLETDSVYSMMKSVSQACMITEFEFYAHEHPDSTFEELSDYYGELLYAYGYDGSQGNKYLWTTIPHVFSMPLYYISYATSAAAALELYNMSYISRNDAIEKYLEISSLSSAWGFKETLDYLDMQNIFDGSAMGEIFDRAAFIVNKRKNR